MKKIYLAPQTERINIETPMRYLASHSCDWADAKQTVFDEEEEDEEKDYEIFPHWGD